MARTAVAIASAALASAAPRAALTTAASAAPRAAPAILTAAPAQFPVTVSAATAPATGTAAPRAAVVTPAIAAAARAAFPVTAAEAHTAAVPIPAAPRAAFPVPTFTPAAVPAAPRAAAADPVKAFRKRPESQESALKRSLQRHLLCMGYQKSIVQPPIDLRRVLRAAQAYEALQDFYQTQDPETADGRMSKAYAEIRLRSHAPREDEFLKMVEEAQHEQKEPTVTDLLGDTANRFLEVQVQRVIQRLKLAFAGIVIHGDLTAFNHPMMDLAILDADAAYAELCTINAQFFPEECWTWSERVYEECRRPFWSAVPDIEQLLVVSEEIRSRSKDVSTPFNTEPPVMGEIMQ